MPQTPDNQPSITDDKLREILGLPLYEDPDSGETQSAFVSLMINTNILIAMLNYMEVDTEELPEGVDEGMIEELVLTDLKDSINYYLEQIKLAKVTSLQSMVTPA